MLNKAINDRIAHTIACANAAAEFEAAWKRQEELDFRFQYAGLEDAFTTVPAPVMICPRVEELWSDAEMEWAFSSSPL